jgi:hypothetical protein
MEVTEAYSSKRSKSEVINLEENQVFIVGLHRVMVNKLILVLFGNYRVLKVNVKDDVFYKLAENEPQHAKQIACCED